MHGRLNGLKGGPKQNKKNQEKPKDKQPQGVLSAYDTFAGGSSQSASSSGGQDSQLFKEFLSYMKENRGEMPENIQRLIPEDNKESIREAQKKLNRHRNLINKISSKQKALQVDQEKWDAWLLSVREEIQQQKAKHEESQARLAKEIAELQEEEKRLGQPEEEAMAVEEDEKGVEEMLDDMIDSHKDKLKMQAFPDTDGSKVSAAAARGEAEDAAILFGPIQTACSSYIGGPVRGGRWNRSDGRCHGESNQCRRGSGNWSFQRGIGCAAGWRLPTRLDQKSGKEPSSAFWGAKDAEEWGSQLAILTGTEERSGEEEGGEGEAKDECLDEAQRHRPKLGRLEGHSSPLDGAVMHSRGWVSDLHQWVGVKVGNIKEFAVVCATSERFLLFLFFIGTDILIFAGVIAWIILTYGEKGRFTVRIDRHRYFRRARSRSGGWKQKTKSLLFTFLLCQQHCGVSSSLVGYQGSEDFHEDVIQQQHDGHLDLEDLSFMTRPETWQERYEDPREETRSHEASGDDFDQSEGGGARDIWTWTATTRWLSFFKLACSLLPSSCCGMTTG